MAAFAPCRSCVGQSKGSMLGIILGGADDASQEIDDEFRSDLYQCGTFSAVFDFTTRMHANRVFLRYRDRDILYSDLRREAAALGEAFAAHDISAHWRDFRGGAT